MNKLTETEKAYLAGLLDGEGCVGIQKKKSQYKKYLFDFGVRVVITNTNYELICWLKEKTGIGCASEYSKDKTYKKNWNPVHRWTVVCEQARGFLIEVYPYLKIKKEITDLVLTLPMTKVEWKIYGRSMGVYEEQKTLFEKAKAKNKRGKKIL